MCHLRHRLIIFLFHRKVVFRSQDIQIFVFLTILWFTKFVTSWWVLVYEAGCIFEPQLINPSNLVNRYKEGQYFSGISWTIWRTGDKFQALFSLATCSSYSITNYVKFPVFHFFEKENKEELKMVNINFWKLTDFAILLFH